MEVLTESCFSASIIPGKIRMKFISKSDSISGIIVIMTYMASGTTSLTAFEMTFVISSKYLLMFLGKIP